MVFAGWYAISVVRIYDYWEPDTACVPQKQRTYTLQLLFGAIWKQSTYNLCFGVYHMSEW